MLAVVEQGMPWVVITMDASLTFCFNLLMYIGRFVYLLIGPM